MKALQPKLLLVAGTILVAALFRLVPHWPNFTPMAAIALMGGALFRSYGMRIAIPMLALLISDYLTVTLINYKWVTPTEYFSSVQTAFVYLGFLSNILVGFVMHRSLSKINLGSASYSAKLAGSSLTTAVLFFLISNYGSWIGGMSFGASNLAEVYMLGIPFFGYNLLGDVFYSFVFFGFLQVIGERYPALSLRKAH